MYRHKHKNPDVCAPGCDDQIPVVSKVGRGIAGDTYKVEISSDSNCETILEGSYFDQASKTWHSEWMSENINGGCLSYQYNLRPFTVPQTFTITFIYRRPGRPEWSWTTPAIPYIWSVDGGGDPNPGDPDTMVGSGVATVFIKDSADGEWVEKLIYPSGTTRDDFNAPEQGEPWTVNLRFGVGGDVEVPNLDDLAKIIGVTVQDLRDIISGTSVTINGVQADNLIDYIDKQDDAVLDHVHEDLGFDEGFLPGDGGDTSVKEYIDSLGTDVAGDITALETLFKNAIGDILEKIYLGGELGEDGHITWPNTLKVPIADLNFFAGTPSPTDATTANSIRSRTLSDNDMKAE